MWFLGRYESVEHPLASWFFHDDRRVLLKNTGNAIDIKVGVWHTIYDFYHDSSIPCGYTPTTDDPLCYLVDRTWVTSASLRFMVR